MSRRSRRNHTKSIADRPITVRQISDIQGNPLTSQPRTVGRVATDADITRDYVARAIGSYLPALQALPHAFDDLTREFGADVYERMATDAEVAANLDVMVLASCANTPRIVPALQPDDPDYVAAQDVATFFSWMFDRVQQQFDAARRSLTRSALVAGSSVAELNFAYVEDGGPYDGHLIVDQIKPTCIKDTAFIVDTYQNIVGILPSRQPNLSIPVGAFIPVQYRLDGGQWEWSDGLKIGTQVLHGAIPRSKFLVLTWNSHCGDPRGSSALRPAYTAWWAKQQIINEMLSWFARFAQPSLWATTAENAIAQCITDSAGNEIRTEPTEVLLRALQQFKNASVMALPYGSSVHTIDVSGSGEIFFRAIEWANIEIARGILKQHLATAEGEHQARAAADVHQDVLSLLILYIKNWQSESIRNDILRPLTIANFGERAMHLIPHIDLGDGDGFPISPETVAQLMRANYFSPEQLPFVDKLLGLPVRQTAA